MKINQIPKHEAVMELETDAQFFLTVSATDENRNYLAEAIFSTYLGEKCKYCGKAYKTLDDLKDTVWAGEHQHGRLACKSCWSANNKAVAAHAKNTALAEHITLNLLHWLVTYLT